MDATPYEFRERVTALWKCCEDGIHDSRCAALRVPGYEWTREMTRVSFNIDCKRGQWKYGFRCSADPGSCLTLEQLQKRFNLEHVTIEAINVSVWDVLEDELTNLCGDDVERLMKLIVYLSNEPRLDLSATTTGSFHSPIGSTLLRCFSNIQFSRIEISKGFPVYNQFLGNQFSRWNPTQFFLNTVDRNKKFFKKHLSNGDMKRFCDRSSADRYSAEVMEGIVNSFLKNTEEYKEGYFHLSAQFDESTEAWLERELQEGSCYRDVDGGYSFTGYNSKLQTQQRLSVKKRGESLLYVCTLS